MRKSQQRKIYELINTIQQAQSAKLYADCQDGALSLCDFIESIEGEGTQTVALLEKYCRILFEVNSGKLNEKILQKHFRKIENSVRSELKPNRTEMVFISYKASMSDSLESIYLAAKADPNCDAYWIAVPYFDFNADRSVNAMHYEGADYYGSHIEVTDWQSYDISAQRPDVIFTFAPYDTNNFVTKIHPDFYCERLRNFTDLLVYTPYFVSFDGIQDNFCTTAGVIYAHKVILQSEKIRDAYIQIFKEHFGSKLGKPEDKFIALGSPKFDKYANIKREDFMIPDEWLKVIKNKKIVLFNSTINAVLSGNIDYLNKLKYVLNVFRKRDDIALWWRPHPLNRVAYQSMRPQLMNEYQQIITDYKNEQWGIYDDTPDLHRAIAYTDGYFGDAGSLLTMYTITGKPVMYSNVNVLSSEIAFYPTDMCDCIENIWFPLMFFNALLKLNKSDMSLEFVGSFPGEVEISSELMLYRAPVECNGNLYFPPNSANEIASYSLTENTFAKIPINREKPYQQSKWSFDGAAVYREYVFFVPRSYPAIIRLDTKTNELVYLNDWDDPDKISTERLHFDSFLVVENIVWLTSYLDNRVMAFDMDSSKSTIYRVGQDDYSYNGLCFDGTNFWLSPSYIRHTNTPVVEWNPISGVLNEYHDTYAKQDPWRMFSRIYYSGGYVWLLTCFLTYSVKINIHTKEVSVEDEFEGDCIPQLRDVPITMKINFVRVVGDDIFIYDRQRKVLIKYNGATKEREEMHVSLTAEIESLLAPMIASGLSLDIGNAKTINTCILYESEIVRIDDFIDHVMIQTDRDIVRRREVSAAHLGISNANGTAGQSIYNYIKDME